MGSQVPESVEYTKWRPTVSDRNKRKRVTLETASKLKAKPSKLDQEQLLEEENEVRYIATDRIDMLQRNRPLGLVWDARDYSCGCDATFSILGNLWAEHPAKWSEYFAYMSGTLAEFSIAMNSVLEKRIIFEQARNTIRRNIHQSNPAHFPYGPNYTSVDHITSVLFPSKFYGIGKQTCATCGYADDRWYGMLESCLTAGLRSRGYYPGSTQGLTFYISSKRQKRLSEMPRRRNKNKNGNKSHADRRTTSNYIQHCA
jgi:hypothetical protein